MRILPPNIDPRKANDVLRALREMAPHYTREWLAKDDDDPGVALLRIFSSIAEGVISRLNRAPDRNFLAFLDMLGIRLLQARPAHVPVKFIVADGTESPFLIEKGTQVSAPPTEQHPEDLPFETTENLLAIPAALTSMFAVDPELDRIYQPPPEFLGLKLAATTPPELILTAFSAAKSRKLQLDPPEQVKPGDFLRIDHKVTLRSGPDQCLPTEEESESIQSEHFVVSEVKGSLVTVTDRLLRDYAEGTPVRKVTQFEVFEARDWQEHILYLGHPEYFAIKSETKITLAVELALAGATLQPLEVAWEFFAEDEETKEKNWFPLELNGDGTVGFSRNGEVLLTKPEGEIKETEIDGRKNRWIRARLTKPLPTLTSLPKIDSIMLKISSAAKDLRADKAFHNDNPLTPESKFLPFGAEPRIFDRFSIASEEAFSKPGAAIELTVSLDTKELLGPPAAIEINNGTDNIVHVFARAVTGRLHQFQINPPAAPGPPIEHDALPATGLKAGSIPAVVPAAGGDIGVFVATDDGKVYLRSIPAVGDARWITFPDLPDPLQSDPVAITNGSNWEVFAVGARRLYKQVVAYAALPASAIATPWAGIIDGPEISSSPFLLLVGGAVVPFVTDFAGHVHMFRGNTWTDLTAALPNPENFLAAEDNARPLARAYNDAGQQFRVFVRNRDSQLIAIDTKAPPEVLPLLPSGVGSNPTSAVDPPNDRIFVRGADDHLWSINDGDTDWMDHGTPVDANLNGDPFAISYRTDDFLSVFSSSKQNELLEFRVTPTPLVFNQPIAAGPAQVMLLRASPTPPGIYYIHILSGPGAGSNHNAVRKTDLDQPPANKDFIVLDSPLDESPTTGTDYELLRQIEQGPIQATSPLTMTLEAGDAASVQTNDYVFAGNQLRTIQAPAVGAVITVDSVWTPEPTGDYVILRPDAQTHGDSPAGNSDRRAVLGSVPKSDHFYDDKFLNIISGPGMTSSGLLIDRYFGSTNNVVLHAAFPNLPTSASSFSITLSNVPAAWHTHKDRNISELFPELSWEYFNGKGWAPLPTEDTTKSFIFAGTIKFIIPDDIAKTEVGGQESFWIRARIVGGDYGREIVTFDGKQVFINKAPIREPVIKSLTLGYELTELKRPQFALTFNNLNFLDQTAANETENKHFPPFVALEDKSKALYFGFDRAFSGAPIKIYFDAKELEVDERNRPKLVWSMAYENDWKELIPEDETEGFTRPDYVTLDIADRFQNTQQFGKALFWLRASLTEGNWVKSPLLSGVFVNTVEARQARTVRDEILGSSTGIKNQKFTFQKTPVIKGEEVRVREALTDQERDQLINTNGKDFVFIIRDQQDRIIETWVKWTEVEEFFDSDSKSRDYRLDRHTGEIEFGDDINGRIPPVGGDNISAFVYQAGGGAAGNVKAGEIDTAVTAVAGVDSVINPVPAGGGSDAATNEDMLTVGPAQISHRQRAVTPEDFERLALEASREVRKARCLPNRNAGGRHELGWTTIRIVPASQDAKPVPSLELRRSVQRHLADRADLTLVDQKHIFVGPPKYVTVSIEGQIFAKTLDDVAKADQRVKKQLQDFLHPLTGGPENQGWEFGRDLAASDLYALLEEIEEVDHVGRLELFADGAKKGEQVSVEPDALIAGGNHKITTVAAS